MQYTDKLDDLEARFEELTRQMADPDVISDSERYRKVTKAQSELGEIVAKYREWKKVAQRPRQAPAPCSRKPIPSCARWPQEEIAALEPAAGAARGGAEGPAAAQGSQRREERRARNPRRHRRRRGHPVRRRDLPHVLALRRSAAAGRWKSRRRASPASAASRKSSR